MERVLIGRIVAPRGLRGELRVLPASKRPGRFSELRQVFVDGHIEPLEVLEAWEHRGAVVLELAGVDTRTKAEELVGRELWVDASEAMVLEPDEYFVHDLVGLEVVTDTGRDLGTLHEVLQGPANDIYVVKGPLGELLVPAVGQVVLKVDLAAKRMVLHDLPGLVEPEPPV